MIRPTPRGVALFALSFPLALAVVAGMPERWPIALYLPGLAAAVMLADLGMMLPRSKMDVRVDAPVRLYMGSGGTITATISCPGWRTATRVEAVAEMEGMAGPPVPVSGSVRDGEFELRLALRPLGRGRIAVSAVHLRWPGPLGAVEHLVRHPCDLATEVVPNVRGLHDDALRFFSRDSVHGFKSQPMRGEGSEFDKLCDYEAGMDNRFIDWKRSARHRKLLSKEFRRERNHQIILGFDAGHLMTEPIGGVPRLDHAIRAGLTLAWVSLHGGDLVGGCGFDSRFRSFIQPGRGMSHFTHLERFAAGLEYRTEETNFTLALTQLGSRLRRRGLVVVFSEFVDSVAAELLLESLQLLTRRHLVVFVTMRDPMLRRLADAPPRSFHAAASSVVAGDFLRDRAVVLEKIARLGVHCLDTTAGGLSSALLNRYVMIKQKGLL